MKNNLIGLTFGLAIILSSCSKEFELDKSVFIPDKDYPDLPAYTEWGYNTFGALYERELFLYNDISMPVKVINTGGKTSFTFKGHKGQPGSSYYNIDNSMSLNFDLYGFLPASYTNLAELNDTIIDLASPLCKVSLMIDTVEHQVVVLNGTLNFKRAQNLFVDKKQIEVILSGTFEIQALIENEPTSITAGRFDVGIGPDNFFKY
jgi:hypothetical protein